MNNSKEYKKFRSKFDKDGVVLINDVWNSEIIDKVRDEYDQLDKSLKRNDIERDVKDEPLIVFWKHVVVEKKRLATFSEFPSLWKLIIDHIVPITKSMLGDENLKLQLLETIIFNKPGETSNTLHWHQDVAYFPFEPNDQIACWIPFEPVDEENGALRYALGSHKHGLRGSTHLHTREEYDDNENPLIPLDPEKAGFEVKCMKMSPKDMLLHDGFTWHYSTPNKVSGTNRRGLSVRMIKNEAFYKPRAGTAAAFLKQIDVKEGEKFKGKPFPVIG